MRLRWPGYEAEGGLGVKLRWSGFSAAACKIQTSKRYIESLPLVLKDKRSCFSQGGRSAVQLPLDRAFALRKWDA